MLLRLLIILLPLQGLAQSSLNVMTFNIRYATPNDGENQWENRKEHVAQTIRFFETEICGLQEATEPQVLYLAENLSNFKWIGVGRDDGKSAGEFSPIFYDTEKLELKSWYNTWLSTTPTVPSKDWDAALPRIATVAIFKRKDDQKEFVVINTHYDHMGKTARVESSKLILKTAKDFEQKGLPVVLMGDFNVTPTDEPILTITNGGLYNTHNISKTGHFGPTNSFTGFESTERENSQIDHIFVSAGIHVLKHATISESWNGKFASDHHAILAKLKF